ncbi:MAG TPA: UDP-N-acetylmuramoyl-L-alanine--D-glutamate ligase [Anaerolineae bacterium]|nr:UDP-N-acetylmuramoyl-L-alanine--D-glutamate ligase [Anaerolineae bacterium]
MADISALSGLRVVIVGLGREGTALATYLARHGFSLTVTDSQPAEKLGTSPATLAAAGVSLVLGEHPLSLLDEADLIFVSPGVPLEIPFLQAARSQKIPLSTESRLFCYLCPAPILAITGSSGKTTTTTLLGKIMEASGRKTWVGGNIGQPLIDLIDQISPTDTVVMELSSFQLEYFHARLNQDAKAEQPGLAALIASWSPPISAILNITPNHLDRHPSMKHYVRAKRAIIDYQGPEGVIVLGLDNDMTRTIGNQFRAKVRWFSLEAQVRGGASVADDDLILLDQNGMPHFVATRQEIKLRGQHNLSNILAACLMAKEAGASIEDMRSVITTFTGVPHRLELVRERQGVSYYNDSVATSPGRLIAALHSFSEPIVLLAGGRDKNLPWEDAARLIVHKTHDVILFGDAAELIAKAIEKADHEIAMADTAVHRCPNLEEAVSLAAQLAKPGDVVLLSPGCASFDAFRNYAERGERFKELVLKL